MLQKSLSSSRWDFHFHSYVLTIYVRLYWILELVVFYSLVRRGYIRKVSVQSVQIYSSRVFSTDSSSCSERKIWKKTRLKQRSKTKEGNQNVVVVDNSPGSHRSTVESLSLRCLTNIATLLLCCRSAVAPLSHRYCSTVATPMSIRCRTAVTPLLHRYRSTVAPLLSLVLLLRSHTAIAPVSIHCCSAAVAPAFAMQSHRYCAVVAPLLNRDRSGPERV